MSVLPGHGAAATPAPEASPETQAPAAAPEAAVPAAAPKEVPSKAFEVLAKKEKAFRQQQLDLKAQREQLERDREIVKRHQGLEAEGKENPLKVLEALGWDYDKLSQFVLNGGKKTPEITANDSMSEIKKLREELEQERKATTEQKRQELIAQQQQAQDQFREEIQDFITGKEEFELIEKLDRKDLVFETIEENFRRTKTVMSIEDAAKLVEGYLEEEELGKLEKIGKLKKRLSPQQEAAAAAQGTQPKASPAPTLSNKQTVSSSPSLLPAATEADRIKRALAALDKK